METMNNRQIALAAGLFLAIVLSGIFFFNNKTLRKNIRGEKIKSETLLSEKLLLDKSIAKFQDDLNSLKGKNAQLDLTIAGINTQLTSKEGELKKLQSENASLRVISAKVKELEALREKLNNELTTRTTELAALKSENQKITKENQGISRELASMQKENELLAANNTILKAMAGNNYRVEAVRGKNEKLTVNARRAQKLIFTFDLPNDIGKNISFKLKTPDNNEFTSEKSKSASIKVTENSNNFYASLNGPRSSGTKNIEMIYIPAERLGRGVYEFAVYNDNVYIGSTRLRLK
jgi:hypothetical protein